jgi:AcrR family transcriptional regulator
MSTVTKQEPTTAPVRRTGRRRGDHSTRQAILDAAIAVFAENGYERATLRAITARAGVDVALVKHFFGSKEGLFDEAVLRHVSTALRTVVAAAAGAPEGLGIRMAEAYLSVWETEPSASVVRALFRVALESGGQMGRLYATAGTYLVSTLRAVDAAVQGRSPDEADTSPESAVRLQLLGSHLLGVGLTRYILKLRPLADLPRERVVADLAPVVERYLRPAAPEPE